MNIAELHKKLIAAARLQTPDDRVPYAFEKRVMAHIAARKESLRSLNWTRTFMRAAMSCVGVAVLFGAWTLLMPAGAPAGDDLSQDLQNTLLASADQSDTTP